MNGTSRTNQIDINDLSKTLIETMPGGLGIDDTEGRLVYANSALCRMLGYTIDEIVGHPIVDILAGWSEDTVYEKIRSRRGGQVEYYDTELIHRTGRLIPVQVTAAPLFNSANDFVGTFAIFLDQTELASSRRAAEQSQQMYRQLFHQSRDAIIIHDLDGGIIDINQRTMELWGCTRSAFLSMNAGDLVHPNYLEKTTQGIRGLSADDIFTAEVQLVRASGQVFPAEMSSILIRTGQEPVVQSIVRDLSRERRAESMIRAMSNRALLYLDILSHDISNQLQVAESATELLGLCCTEESQVELLTDLKHALGKMARIVVKTKITGQLMGSTLRNRDLVQAVKSVVKQVGSLYPELNITISIGMTEAPVRADDLLEHLISNLLENAYEHNPFEEKHAWVTVMPASTGYELRVADTGPGIPEDIRVGLLQPSRRRAGLGLHMSWHIAQKYGGKLQIKDRVSGDPTQGAAVVVWLPAAIHDE